MAVLALKPVFSGDWGGVDGAKKIFCWCQSALVLLALGPMVANGDSQHTAVDVRLAERFIDVFTRGAPRICSYLWRQTPLLSGHCITGLGASGGLYAVAAAALPDT